MHRFTAGGNRPADQQYAGERPRSFGNCPQASPSALLSSGTVPHAPTPRQDPSAFQGPACRGVLALRGPNAAPGLDPGAVSAWPVHQYPWQSLLDVFARHRQSSQLLVLEVLGKRE
jgi:hypothetical protein